jgi:ribose transport system ATP-binding protein
VARRSQHNTWSIVAQIQRDERQGRPERDPELSMIGKPGRDRVRCTTSSGHAWVSAVMDEQRAFPDQQCAVGDMSSEHPELVRLEGISKRFGPVQVLSDVNMVIRAGEVHLLAGENGAGKSTLLKILGGIHTSFEGEIVINGRSVRPRSPHHAEALGVAMIHQELSLVPSMSVADNIMLGRHPTRLGFVRKGASMRAVREALGAVGLEALDPTRLVGELPIAVQQLIEIAKAVRLDASVIVMDEPTSALNAPDVASLFGLIERLAADGRGVVFISHRMEELRRIGDWITVLRDGALAGGGPMVSFDEADIIRMMLGREVEQENLRAEARERGEERLRIEGVSVRPTGRGVSLHDVSLTLGAGEIVGLAGLQGGGASELLNALFGAKGVMASGRIAVDGKAYEPKSPREAIRRGLALLTNDRKATGLVNVDDGGAERDAGVAG